MRNILFLALLVLFAGCSQRWCVSRYPPSVDTVRVSVTRDTIIYRDTIIFLEVQGERVIDSVLIPCPEVKNYIADTVRAKTSFALAKAWWEFPHIRLDLTQTDSVVILRAELKELRHYQSEHETITKTPQPVKYIPQFYKICTWLLIGMFVAAGGYVAFKFMKK